MVSNSEGLKDCIMYYVNAYKSKFVPGRNIEGRFVSQSDTLISFFVSGSINPLINSLDEYFWGFNFLLM